MESQKAAEDSKKRSKYKRIWSFYCATDRNDYPSRPSKYASHSRYLHVRKRNLFHYLMGSFQAFSYKIAGYQPCS